jgi:hypothetical protein
MLLAYMTVEDRNGNDDPWTGARAIAREDVHTALAPRDRRCPSCGAVQRGGGRTCARCGAELTARLPRHRLERRPVYAGLAVVLVMLAAAAVPVIGGLREDAAGERERAAARQAALEAAERERLVRDARPVRTEGAPLRAGTDLLEHRAALVAEGERLIAADARARAADGSIKGDIQGAECDPFPTTAARRAAEQQRSLRTGRYDCVAYTSRFKPSDVNRRSRTGLFGYPYWLVLDYASSDIVFCKVTPRAGEGGQTLVSVPVPVPCRDPAGPG